MSDSSNDTLVQTQNWNNIFRYENGKIYWLSKPSKHIPAGTEAGCCDEASGYVLVKYRGVLHRAHRIIWEIHNGPLGDAIIDHNNRIKTDNRIENLRKGYQDLNQKNRSKQKNNKSGYTGVCWDSNRQTWNAKIQVNGKTVNLGRFAEKDDAISARLAAEIQYDFHPTHGK